MEATSERTIRNAWLATIAFKLTRHMREITFIGKGDFEPLTWVYNCGWRIKGWHPYRPPWDWCNLNQPIGILEFYRETGYLPILHLN